MKKILCLLLLGLFLPTIAFAASTVDVAYSGAPSPIFTEAYLAPGDTTTKTITVTSNSAVNEQFKFQASATIPVGLLADKVNIRVVNIDTAIEKYNDSLASLYSAGEVNLDVLAPASPVRYNFIATFDPSAGNEYMGLSEKFDLTIGFAVTPTTNPTTVEGGSNPANPLTAFAGFLGFVPTTVTTTDVPAVAGVETVAETSEVKGDEKENNNVRGSSDKVCPWWWIIALALAVVLAFVGGVIRAVRDDNFIRKYYLVWPALFGVIAWIAHYFLHGGYQPTWFCNNYWLAMLLEVLIAYILYQLVLRKKDPKNS